MCSGDLFLFVPSTIIQSHATALDFLCESWGSKLSSSLLGRKHMNNIAFFLNYLRGVWIRIIIYKAMHTFLFVFLQLIYFYRKTVYNKIFIATWYTVINFVWSSSSFQFFHSPITNFNNLLLILLLLFTVFSGFFEKIIFNKFTVNFRYGLTIEFN